MPVTLEFFFDFMSPYTYLASTQIDALAVRNGAHVRWRPVHLPGVFKAAGTQAPIETPAKAIHNIKDLGDWSKHYGIPPLIFPEGWPGTLTAANRVALALEAQGKTASFARKLFARLWTTGDNGNSPALLAEMLSAEGVDAAAVLAEAATEPVKQRLRDNTEELVKRGGYGLPTIFVGEEMFVGNDRLMFVEAAVKRLNAAGA
ncbi:MAG: 2-hydroxychromene-2-carboxylate isomerase [Myxococcaceae bacterium]|nr:2-hydroxychromene-2-carboxylate isomerase [Myxococcaceae bacterium]